jgi:hypothetical protein
LICPAGEIHTLGVRAAMCYTWRAISRGEHATFLWCKGRNSMSSIIFSYRRDDSAGTFGRIYKRLVTHFKDVDDIPYGVHFPDYLREQLRACRIELVIIGKLWLTLTIPRGTRRLDHPDDFARIVLSCWLEAPT